jgi:RNA polymerase sigma-70 factor (ECF subfamily)
MSNDPADNPFQALIRRVRAGDQEAAAELIRQYEPTIRRVARVRLADASLRRALDSMDVCQSVLGSFFVRAALGQFELETPEQLLHLLVNMSRKKVIDHARRAQAARRDQRRTQDGEPAEWQAVSPEPSPSQQAMLKELMVEAQKRLTPEEQHLAEQRRNGLDWQQIAQEQGRSPEAVRKQLARAIERVSRELGLDIDT